MTTKYHNCAAYEVSGSLEAVIFEPPSGVVRFWCVPAIPSPWVTSYLRSYDLCAHKVG